MQDALSKVRIWQQNLPRIPIRKLEGQRRIHQEDRAGAGAGRADHRRGDAYVGHRRAGGAPIAAADGPPGRQMLLPRGGAPVRASLLPPAACIRLEVPDARTPAHIRVSVWAW